MKKIALLAMLTFPLFASADEEKVYTAIVIEDKYQWKLELQNCRNNIDPTEELVVVKKKFPAETVTVKQDRAPFKCQVKRIEVIIT